MRITGHEELKESEQSIMKVAGEQQKAMSNFFSHLLSN